MSEKTAAEVQAAAAKEPTLDEYMNRDPATLNPPDLHAQVELLRGQRLDFTVKEAKRAAKREGVEE